LASENQFFKKENSFITKDWLCASEFEFMKGVETKFEVFLVTEIVEFAQ